MYRKQKGSTDVSVGHGQIALVECSNNVPRKVILTGKSVLIGRMLRLLASILIEDHETVS